MTFRPSNAAQFARSRPMTDCAQCGEWLFAPEWSEHVDDHCVRHLWECEACGYTFETTVSYVSVGGFSRETA